MNRFELRDEGALSYGELAARRASEQRGHRCGYCGGGFLYECQAGPCVEKRAAAGDERAQFELARRNV